MRKGMSGAGQCHCERFHLQSEMGRPMTLDRREDLDPGRLDSCRRRADGSGGGPPDLDSCICLETGKETRVFSEIPILPICVGAGVSSGEISDRLPLCPDLSPAATYILLLSNLVPLSQSPPSRPPSAPRPTTPPPPPPTHSRSRWLPPIRPPPCPCALPAKRKGTSASTTPTTRTHIPLRRIHTHILLISTATDLQPQMPLQDPRGARQLHPRSSPPPPSRLLRTARTRQTRFIF